MDNPDNNSQALYSENTWNVMLAVLAITIFSVIALGIAVNNEPLYNGIKLVATIAYGVAMLVWCTVDSRERGIELGYGFRIFIVLLGVLALIFYLFKTRGLKGGFVSIGYAFLFFLATIFISSIVAMVFNVLTGVGPEVK
jgi:hypothetical protein